MTISLGFKEEKKKKNKRLSANEKILAARKLRRERGYQSLPQKKYVRRVVSH